MRLAFVDPEPPSETGGGIRTYIRLASALCRRRGFEVRIYTHNPGAYADLDALPIRRKHCLPRGLRALGYRLCHAEIAAFEHASWLAEELRAGAADFAEFPDFQGYAYYALRDAGLRTRVTLRVHTPLYLVYADGTAGTGLAFRLLRYRERSCLRRALRITAPSGEFVREKLPWLKNYRVIPNPPPPLAGRMEEAQPYAGGAAFKIAFLGRLESRKGALVLLQAFLSLSETHPQATLTLIGDAADLVYAGELNRRLEAAPEGSRRRVFQRPGQTGDKSKLLREFTCLVVPSRWENSPYVFWEGMAAGIPCLGSDTGEMKRARTRIGFPRVTPDDAASLAEALSALIASPELRRETVARQNTYLEEVAAASENLTDFYSQCAPIVSASA